MGAVVSPFREVFAAEWRRFLTDRGAVLVLLVAPLLYALFYPLPYLRQVPKKLPVVLVDSDHSELSRLLARKADENELLRVVGESPSMREAERLVRDREATAILAIPRNFERDVKRGGGAVVGGYVDASYFLPYRQALTGLTTAVGAVSAGVEIKRWESSGLPRAAAEKRQAPMRVESHNLFNPEGGYANYVVPAVLVLIFQQTLLIGVGMLLGTARERGAAGCTFVGAPLPVTVARATAYVSLYLAHFTIYRFAVYPLFGFPFVCSFPEAVGFLLPFLYACVFMAFALGRLWRERESSMIFLVASSLPALFVCGFAWPVEAIPRWIRALSQLLPSTPGIMGYLKLVQMGAAPRDVLPEWLLLWALAVLYAYLAVRPWRDISAR